jgi:6,7-dimethyl-8-ribityllumazine synthase
LPFTTAKFCAIADKLSVATKLKANFESFIRFLRLQLNLVRSKFYRQSVKPIVQEFLERIIHKAVTLDAIELFKMSGGNDHPVMAVETQIIGTSMAGVLRTFVDDF